MIRYAKEHSALIVAGAAGVGGLVLASVVGNYIDNGHLFADIVSWNVPPIEKYGELALGATVIGEASATVPALATWGVSFAQRKIAERSFNATLTTPKKVR